MTSGNDDKNSNDDDSRLFREAMADVDPLRHDRSRVVADETGVKPVAIPAQRRADERAVLSELATANYDPRLHEHGTELQFLRSGYKAKVLKDLRRGRFSVEGNLDLHGMNAAQAKRAVADFIVDAVARKIACVRIVHGKGHRSPRGEPVIKPLLAEWLAHHDAVIAYCSAPQHDGGTGAVYVALRW